MGSTYRILDLVIIYLVVSRLSSNVRIVKRICTSAIFTWEIFKNFISTSIIGVDGSVNIGKRFFLNKIKKYHQYKHIFREVI